MIRLYFIIPEEFVSLIFQDRCWFVHMSFVCMVIFQCLPQFPVDRLTHPVYYYFYNYYNYRYNCYYSIESFSHQHQLIFFHWSLSDSKSPQVSRIVLSIRADLNNTVVWMESPHPPISNSCSPLASFWRSF